MFTKAAETADVARGTGEIMIDENLVEDQDTIARVQKEFAKLIDGAREILRDALGRELETKA